MPHYTNKSDINDSFTAFYKYVRDHIRFQELDDPEFQFSIVPIKFKINSEGFAFDLIFVEEHIPGRSKQKVNKQTPFIKEAARLIKAFPDWVPFLNEGEYVESWMKVQVPFYYSSKYFEKDVIIELNPDSKAVYIGEEKIYDCLVNNKFGCDGVVHTVFVIEPNGCISSPELISCQGKTNWQMGEAELWKLNQWLPATKDGQPVASQIDLVLYI